MFVPSSRDSGALYKETKKSITGPYKVTASPVTRPVYVPSSCSIKRSIYRPHNETKRQETHIRAEFVQYKEMSRAPIK